MPNDITKATYEDVQNYRQPELGQRISAIERRKIDEARNICAEVNAASAVDFLLSRLHGDIELVWASVFQAWPESEGKQGVSIYLLCDNHNPGFVTAIVGEEGAALLSGSAGEKLVGAGRAEVEQHILTNN